MLRTRGRVRKSARRRRTSFSSQLSRSSSQVARHL
jgi:hypothetical protein